MLLLINIITFGCVKPIKNYNYEKDGSLSDVKVMRSLGSGCDEEAVRVINSMPKWKPGKNSGKEVRTKMLVPITFWLI